MVFCILITVQPVKDKLIHQFMVFLLEVTGENQGGSEVNWITVEQTVMVGQKASCQQH